MQDETRIQGRIQLLEAFLCLLTEYQKALAMGAMNLRHGRINLADSDKQEIARLRSLINRKIEAAGRAVSESGTGTTLVYTDPPVIGGRQHRLNVFENIFSDMHGTDLLPFVVTHTERAIGAYEAMKEDPNLFVASKQTIDIVDAVNRSLRPAFKDPPNNEREVQNEVEQILRVLGTDYVRDKEVAPVGPTFFRPDFTVASLDLAIEVKFAKDTHGASDVQREIAEDVAGYRTKWKHLLVVVYDLGAIRDPEQMKRENEQHFGVTVLIIKH